MAIFELVAGAETRASDIVVVGAAGSGLKVLEILEANAVTGNGAVNLVGFLDDDASLQGTDFYGYPVLGPVSSIDEFVSTNSVGVVCAIGDPLKRWKIVQPLWERGVKFPNVAHPSALISPRAHIGVGNVFSQSVVIQPGVRLGDFNSFNIAAVCGPLAQLGSYCTVNSQVMIASGAEVGDYSYIGMGAKIKQRLSVARGSRVGANTYVSKPTKPWTTVFGVPGRVIGRRPDPFEA